MADVIQEIKKKVEGNKIILFIKGTKEMPQCGFSAAVVGVFDQIGKPYETVDILSNPEVRSRMEEYSNWPTFPQIFIGGEFIGGCDIVTQMYENGQLEPIVEKAFISL